MPDQVLSFYNSMAEHYHLIFEDWDQSVRRQAAILNSLLARELPGRQLRILDCACGIGTQSLGLAALGHQVVGSDLSPLEITRAVREAQARGLSISFYVSDMTELKEVPEAGFDVVAAFDNALPHLTSDELIKAVRAMGGRLNSGGLFVASIRDYDSVLQQRPAMQEPSFFGRSGNRRIVHQVWDWTNSAEYILHLYITVEASQGWHTHHFITPYRCVRRREVSDALLSEGFEDPVWLMPQESGYYQPLVLARWP